jgi:acetyl esterase
VQALLDQSRAARRAPRDISPGALRALDTLTATMFALGSPAAAVEREIRVGGAAGELRALLYAPATAPGERLPIVVHFHGGGFVWMIPEVATRLCRDIAVGARAVVVSVDYRLAPEHPYPAPLDDCEAAFRWIRQHAAELGGDPARMGVAGESAGGNLAAEVALRTTATGNPPSGVALLYAWLDLTMASPSFRAFGPDDPFIDDELMTSWQQSYAADPALHTAPDVSPLYADVSAFPPACVIVGGIDPLYDDGVSFAEKLRAAGRDVELHEYEGMPHLFSFFPQLKDLADPHQRAAAFFARTLHRSPC